MACAHSEAKRFSLWWNMRQITSRDRQNLRNRKFKCQIGTETISSRDDFLTMFIFSTYLSGADAAPQCSNVTTLMPIHVRAGQHDMNRHLKWVKRWWPVDFDTSPLAKINVFLFWKFCNFSKLMFVLTKLQYELSMFDPLLQTLVRQSSYASSYSFIHVIRIRRATTSQQNTP